MGLNLNLNVKEQLENFETFANQNKVNINYNSQDLIEVFKTELTSDNNDTISLYYREDIESIVLVISGNNPHVIVKKADPDDFMELCKVVEVEENNDYNMSKNLLMNGFYIRVFALTKPLSNYPNITISTAKQPPATWHQFEVMDELDKIVEDNFIIVGGSGSGKTYLMNFMLYNHFRGTKKKIGFIEEFSELFPPNDSTSKIIVPPPKPGEPRLLEFITEQSNLMRFNHLFVGEIKGPESWPFVINLSSGTRGGATIHGQSCHHGLRRLESLCMMSGMPEKVVDEMIAKSIKYVIHVENHSIKQIIKLTGVVNNNNFQSQTIFVGA